MVLHLERKVCVEKLLVRISSLKGRVARERVGLNTEFSCLEMEVGSILFDVETPTKHLSRGNIGTVEIGMIGPNSNN
jgi:hypothetical protein